MSRGAELSREGRRGSRPFSGPMPGSRRTRYREGVRQFEYLPSPFFALQEAGESIRARLKPLRSGSTTTDTTWRACNEPVPQPAVLDRAGAGRRAARTAAAEIGRAHV